MGYGYTDTQRPPMPDRFIPGQISQPRSQLPRNVSETVKTTRPAQLFGWPEAQGIITDHSVYTCAADTSEHTMKSLKLSPGTISNIYGGFKFRAGGQASGSGGVKTITVKFGGITFGTLSVATSLRSWLLDGEVWNNGYTFQQRWRLICYDGASPAIETMNVSATTSLSVETL